MRKQKFDIQRRKSVCLSQYHCAFQKRCFMRDTCKNNAKQWCYILKLMYGCRPGSSKFQNLKNSSTQKKNISSLYLFKYLSRFWLWTKKKLAVLLNVKCVKKINLIQNFSKIKSDVFKKLPIQWWKKKII